MKWRYFLSALLISTLSFCQSISSDNTVADSTDVKGLVALSKKYRWADSYRSLAYADQALLLAQSHNDKEGIAMANNQKAFCFWAFGDNELAVEAGLEAMKIASDNNYPLIQAESHYVLARGYMDVNEITIARESIQKAEALADNGKDWELLCSIYNLTGVILFIDNKIDSALYFYNLAFKTGKDHAVDPVNFPRIISNIGECYTVENPALAFTNFNQALTLARETNNRIAEASITDILGHAYLQRHDLKNAATNLQSSLQLARTLGLRRVIRNSYAGLVDIRLQQGRGADAVVYLRRYYNVRDSLLNSSKIRQIVELEARYELQMKDQNIRILENEKQIQTIWNNLLVGLAIFLILFSIGLYQLQKYRYRKNRRMLDLEIDYLTQQRNETEHKYKTLAPEPGEPLESHDQKLLKKAIAMVDDNIADPLFSVEKMATGMNMSRTNLHRKIKSITGFPPSELIRSIRLRKAARLISSKVDSVSQIALLVGFDDYSHFSKSFKKHFGVAPSGYEEKLKS